MLVHISHRFPQVTCIFPVYVEIEASMSEKYKSDKWGILWYITKILRRYFTTCRRKYGGQTKSVQSTMGSVDIVTST